MKSDSRFKKFLIFIFAILIFFALEINMIISEDSSSLTFSSDICPYTVFPDEINDMRGITQYYMNEYGIDSKYTDVLLAQLYQESGAFPYVMETDPWQSSESKCGEIGCIDDPRESTEQAMKLYKSNIEKAEALDINDPRAIIQSYNYGPGYLEWLAETQQVHSQDVAWQYSVEMTEKNPEYATVCPQDERGMACYGDYQYVEKIFEKLCVDINNEELQ